ncbi:MAG: DJ-1/PfpI family protein [Bacteroides sp.]|nr:DJ-1/PfpI family protein [Bacteroides sp.]
MKNQVCYLLLNDYAGHEAVYLAQAILNGDFGYRPEPKYINKTVAPTLEPVRSVGGFRTLPDYSFDTMPQDYAALVLVGGYGWMEKEADRVVPIVKRALEKGIPVGAICNGTSFMAKHGFLNHVKHTGNGLDQLKLWGGANYTNEAGYRNEQVISDGGIVTANGSATLEFAREMLLLLKNDTPEMIERYYQFNKKGFVELLGGAQNA